MNGHERSRRRGGWFFVVLMVGGFVASGIYLGIIRATGAATADVVRAIAFFFFGLLMLWRVLGSLRR